jgi:chaperone modulatory protein CbpM
MNLHLTETVWLNDTELCTLEHLAQASGLSRAELRDLIDCGTIVPAAENAGAEVFHLQYIIVARTARRLRDDFELNSQGMVLALNLLRRIEALERALSQAQGK